jgi:hypothetical protein
LVQSAGAEGWTVYEPQTDSLHVLNESARAIWELCDGKTAPEEMAAAITQVTGLSLEEASSDVAATLQTLHDLGLVDYETVD